MFIAPRGIVGAWKQYSLKIVRVIPRPAGAVGASTVAVEAAVDTETNQGEPE